VKRTAGACLSLSYVTAMAIKADAANMSMLAGRWARHVIALRHQLLSSAPVGLGCYEQQPSAHVLKDGVHD
jgi:hypothetical protein